MPRTLEDHLRWSEDGTRTFLEAVQGMFDDRLGDLSTLPGWTLGHVVAHVAANADALRNLVRWASTGEETPMYASAQDRANGIEQGARLPPRQLITWLEQSCTELAAATEQLTGSQWDRHVQTAQGRQIPATEIPWLRAREVWIHAVDLGLDVAFSNLPTDFLLALVEEISARRELEVTEVLRKGDLPDVAAWLAGRPHQLKDAARLEPWI